MRATGEWTQQGAPAVLARAVDYLKAGTVDLSDIQQFDSAGLALMLELTRRAKAQGRSLQFTHLPPALGTLASFFEVDMLLSVT